MNRISWCLWIAGLLLVGGLAGCGSTQQTGNGNGTSSSPPPSSEGAGLGLAPADSSVRTVQLYRGSNEAQLPILSLRSDQEALTLEFDLLTDSGRPLSVYFYHADRTWQRDLSPPQYMDGFQSDNLLDYRPSRGTDVRYTHYTYQFPNDDIDFLISGNYIVRVTEQGRPSDVLFERAFFLTEEVAPVQVGIESIMVSGQPQASEIPIARFTPPRALQGDPYNYDVCFTRNGQFGAARCSDRPNLSQQPELEFDLVRGEAFAPVSADYFVDIANLQPNQYIQRVDRAPVPPRVVIEPDYARFPGTPLAQSLRGQIIVEGAVRDVGVPDTEAQYVNTRFSFVPPNEQPLGGRIAVVGSFSDGAIRPQNEMTWVPERGRYEADVLLKQGQYEYQYDSPDPAVRAVLQEGLSSTPRRSYTVFVYYNDITQNTDRLLAVRTVQSR